MKYMFKKLRKLKKLKNFVSTPWPIYFVIIILASTLVFIGHVNGAETSCMKEICKNLGYGIAGSFWVAFLIDIATTSGKRRKDSCDMKELLSPYKKVFLDMRDSVLDIAEKRFGGDEIQRNFSEWVQYAICEECKNESSDDYWENTFSFFFYVERIRDITEALYNELLLHMDNSSIDRDYRDHIKHIHFVAATIIRDWEQKKWDNAVRTVKTSLLPTFLKYNMDCEQFFNTPYSVSRWETE